MSIDATQEIVVGCAGELVTKTKKTNLRETNFKFMEIRKEGANSSPVAIT